MQHGDPVPLPATQIRDLRGLAGALIPASAEYGVPGADDPLIFASILAGLGRDAPAVAIALEALAGLAGGTFADLDTAGRAAAVTALHLRPSEATAALHRVVLLCYYRDDRVMRALGMQPRAPFPDGFALEPGDWSLLEPVRARVKLWRDAG